MADGLLLNLEEAFSELPNWEQLKEAWRRFSLPADEQGFDPWPFNQDHDGLTVLQELDNNVVLIRDLGSELATAVEYVALKGEGMSGEDKLDLVLTFLVPLITRRLTGVGRAARFLVKPILKHIITAVVRWLNEKMNATDPGKSFLEDGRAEED